MPAALASVAAAAALTLAAPALAPAVGPAPGPAAVAEDRGPRLDGRLVPSYEPARTLADQQVETFLKDNRVLEEIADYANGLVGLPYDIPLRGASCAEPNAYWDRSKGDITYCYGFVNQLKPVFEQDAAASGVPDRRAQVDRDLIGLSNGIVFHEFGHALVALYKLPITGKEEDAVDQLASFLLSMGDETHRSYAVSTIKAWGGLALADRNNRRVPAYADEHSLAAQRFYSWACWLYGSDPRKYRLAVRTDANPRGVLPQERAERCPGEFAQLDTSWRTLLAPYLKQQATENGVTGGRSR